MGSPPHFYHPPGRRKGETPGGKTKPVSFQPPRGGLKKFFQGAPGPFFPPVLGHFALFQALNFLGVRDCFLGRKRPPKLSPPWGGFFRSSPRGWKRPLIPDNFVLFFSLFKNKMVFLRGLFSDNLERRGGDNFVMLEELFRCARKKVLFLTHTPSLPGGWNTQNMTKVPLFRKDQIFPLFTPSPIFEKVRSSQRHLRV
ncbi:hypothetical protein CDSM653_02441 [Caldanaerobacter subterraneus subsp. pacificus DSM 12653]|uniref:Uncharacterized protein n=1 Tax=Caldanaerobacter subterraneus subsp. pacificus DSM 12653 TaxID=391606 RepID=A0A0F5PIS9_9THEO|nr:hypothetical protein CDSM653_02441 [Caldanaerobacter subterraneus subsp. pacificus DSM 12653]